MYASEATSNLPSPIHPNRPISALPKSLISLATPLESALPRKATQHFVTPIESTQIFRNLHICGKCVSVTLVSTTLAEHAPGNPIRMNTSTKHIGTTPPPSHVTNSYESSYFKTQRHLGARRRRRPRNANSACARSTVGLLFCSYFSGCRLRVSLAMRRIETWDAPIGKDLGT
jgi:hypothetical protein